MNIQDLHDIDISGSRKEVARYRCESSLYEFLRRAWKWVDPSPFADGWPIEAVAEHLEAVCDGDIKRLIVNIPPRFGKSTVCSVAFPAWVWAQRFKSPTSGPGVQFLTASYAAQLSVRDSVKCRRLIDSPWYQELWGDRFQLASDQNVKSRFDNDHGGSRLSTSVGSALTGEGGNCFPAWVKVSTPGGYRPIANVFAGDMVLAFDHSLGKVVNSRVIAARQLKTDELYEIRTVSGYSFQCTGNHPVFVSGRGYIRADSLGSGDTVIVERGQANSVAPALRQLREGNHEAIVRGQKGFEAGQQGRLLLQKVLFGSSRIQKLKGLCDLWRWAVSWACGGLLKRMRGPETVGQAQEKKLSNLQKDICWPKYVLLREMRGPCPFRKNDGNKQCKLQVFGKILQSIQIHAANCFGAGRVFLPGVWAFAAGNSVGEKIPHEFAHSPHRRKQPEQSSRKLDNTLPDMPQASPFWGADVIQTVECYSGPEISVYDIQVEGCSNFFANGVLVHNCIIVDDPNGAQDATSEAVIESTIEWFDNALSTRLNDPKSGAIIIIQQRLAENDLTGHILEKQVGDWTHLCLPMRYEPDRSFVTGIGWKDPRETEGELLWPERFGEPEVRALEKTLGPWAAAGQLQQRPEPKGGGVIKREWWQTWPSDNYPPVEYIIASLDTAYTTKTENDYSALTVWGIFSGANTTPATKYVNRESGLIDQSEQTILFDKALEQRFQIKVGGDENTIPKVMCMMAWAERLELHDLIKKVGETCKTYKVDKLIIENKGSGISVAQEIRRLYSHERFAVQLVDPKGQDKLARLHSVAHLFAEGMIYAPDRDWADKLITQVGQFPRGKHDDLVDTVSMAIRYLRDAGLLVRSPEWAAEVKSAMTHTGSNLQPLY
jgi:predicted phage terminase large subunit-like protein